MWSSPWLSWWLFKTKGFLSETEIVMWDVITTRDFVTRISVVTTQVTRARDTSVTDDTGHYGHYITARWQCPDCAPHSSSQMTDTHNDHRHRTTTCPPGDTGLLNFVYITTPVTTVTDTHLASSSLSSEGRLCSVLDNICQGHKCWQSDHIEHEREATIVSKAWLGDAWLTLGPICLHLPLLRKPLRSLHSSLLSAGSRQHLPRSGSTLPRLALCRPSAAAQGCKAAPHI